MAIITHHKAYHSNSMFPEFPKLGTLQQRTKFVDNFITLVV